jgi:hypothetical protein
MRRDLPQPLFRGLILAGFPSGVHDQDRASIYLRRRKSIVESVSLTYYVQMKPVLVLALLIIALALAAEYSTFGLAQPVKATSIAQTSESRPAAEIDSSSLISNSGNPTITGRAHNVSSITVLIYPSDPKQKLAYGVYGAFQGLVDVHNGQWQFSLTGPSDTGVARLDPGTYIIEIRQYDPVTPPGAQGLAILLNGPILTTGALRIVKAHVP